MFCRGLGFAICCRLLDEFLATRPSTYSISLIFTTRSRRKGQQTEALIREHLRRRCSKDELSRIVLISEILDLTSLLSVRGLSERLKSSIPKLDAIILNAGFGGFTGLDWPLAVWTVLTDWIHAVTWPRYKLAAIGSLTGPQLASPRDIDASGTLAASSGASSTDVAISSEPPLGDIFCANVFGHYLLVHWLNGLLSRSQSSTDAGRIIWISSVEAVEEAFSISDIQGLQSATPYESSKRLTDLLALTAELPSTKPWIDRFLPAEPKSSRAETYLMHPGICATSIIPLPYILQLAILIQVVVYINTGFCSPKPRSPA